MPRNTSLPTIIDYLDSLSISFIKKHGYLSENKIQRGVISWKRDYSENRISIEVNTTTYPYIMKLSYICYDESIELEFRIIEILSNLGKGYLYYFICPFIHKPCRKLYSFGRYFCHREAIPNGFYHNQTFSESDRSRDKIVSYFSKVEGYQNDLNKKYFKTHYKGKATKKFLNLNRKINRYKGLTISEYESLFLL